MKRTFTAALLLLLIFNTGLRDSPEINSIPPKHPPDITHVISEDSLRIISYNIHHTNPPSKPGVIDISALINILKKYPADIIALQEVDVNTGRSGKIHEAKLIADALGMHVFFGKAIDFDGGHYGIALLSTLPLKDTQVLQLPMDTSMNGEPRILLTASLTLTSGRTINIACTHLDHQSDESRKLQIAAINEWAKMNKGPLLLAGDLNAEPGSNAIKLFDKVFSRTCTACPPTFPDINPDRTIDHIGFKKTTAIEVISHQVLPEPNASDHLPIRAVIRLSKD